MCTVQVAESGLDFVIVRTAKTDGEAPSSDTGVSVTPQGSLTSSSTATKSQVSLKPLPVSIPPPPASPHTKPHKYMFGIHILATHVGCDMLLLA